MQLSSGTLLERGKYRIISTLGRGGFGITYLAEHALTRRKVCIKEFFPKDYYKRDVDSCAISLSSDGFAESMNRYKAKFIKEAQTIATFNHPNIIPIHDAFEENGTAYYVMDYIEGESLSDVVKRDGALDEAAAVGYIHQVAEALDYIHRQKVMHLDVKPGNVMLSKEDGRAVLIDFGLSKHYDSGGEQTSTTPVGVSHGYAPMEQYQQGGVSSFSPAADIYSLGATLYYLVTGATPPEAAKLIAEPIDLPQDISRSVSDAITSAMNISPKQRPQSIKEFLALLDDNAPKVAAAPIPVAMGEETVISTPQPKQKISTAAESMVEQPKMGNKRSKWWLWVLVFCLLGVGGYYAKKGINENLKADAEQARIALEMRETEAAENDQQEVNESDHQTEEERINNMIAQGLGRDGVYNVGDYYNRNGKEGVVFEVSDGGRHGKIVSLDETQEVYWYTGKEWCQNKGNGWYMPSKHELQTIFGCKSEINNTLSKNSAEGIGEDIYWSSTEDELNEFCAWRVDMYDGNTNYVNKYFGNYVRAVSAF